MIHGMEAGGEELAFTSRKAMVPLSWHFLVWPCSRSLRILSGKMNITRKVCYLEEEASAWHPLAHTLFPFGFLPS